MCMCVTHSLRLTSGLTPGNLLVASMAAKPISSRYLQAEIGGAQDWAYHAADKRSTDWAMSARLVVIVLKFDTLILLLGKLYNFFSARYLSCMWMHQCTLFKLIFHIFWHVHFDIKSYFGNKIADKIWIKQTCLFCIFFPQLFPKTVICFKYFFYFPITLNGIHFRRLLWNYACQNQKTNANILATTILHSVSTGKFGFFFFCLRSVKRTLTEVLCAFLKRPDLINLKTQVYVFCCIVFHP